MFFSLFVSCALSLQVLSTTAAWVNHTCHKSHCEYANFGLSPAILSILRTQEMPCQINLAMSENSGLGSVRLFRSQAFVFQHQFRSLCVLMWNVVWQQRMARIVTVQRMASLSLWSLAALGWQTHCVMSTPVLIGWWYSMSKLMMRSMPKS